MNTEEFENLKPGDRLIHNEEYTHVNMWIAPGYSISLTNGVEMTLDDDWLKDVQIANMPASAPQPAAANMVRIEVVISGVDINSKAWAFIEEAMNDVIEQYGGEVTEWLDTTPR